MILDSIGNWKTYRAIHERIARGLEWLATQDLAAIEDGKYEIDGKDLYASVQHNNLKKPVEARWEAHRRYADIQCVVTGPETVGCRPAEGLMQSSEYNVEKDIIFFDGKADAGNRFVLEPGMFAVFFPQDAHMPSTLPGNDSEPCVVKKIVIKAAI